jgi:Cu(I)/Ag(I) efflux system membrane fusion protein
MASPKLKLTFVLAVAILAVAAAVFAVQPRHTAEMPTDEAQVDQSGLWYCPMHAHVTSDHEGTCPICGMKLVKRAQSPAPRADDRVFVTPHMQQRLGVVVETVEAMDFRPTFEVAAQVIADERRAVTLSPKVEGWIKRLGVSAAGQPIRAGQVLFEIYSPELQERQKDYVDLLTRRDALLAAKDGQSGMQVGNSPPDLMLASVARERFRARGRLLAADVPESVLDDLERFRRVHEVIPVLAAHDGVVGSIGARAGAYVRPGEVIVSYSDRHSAWAELMLTPSQLAQLHGGDAVELHSAAGPDVRVSSPVDPTLTVVDPISRTARVRVPLVDAADRFLPGTLLNGTIHLRARRVVTIPTDTVLRTGRGDCVILAAGQDHFRQRAVRLGAESHDRVEVLEGLSPGETVVTNGQFMVSAEGSLQSSWNRFAAAEPRMLPAAEHTEMHQHHEGMQPAMAEPSDPDHEHGD